MCNKCDDEVDPIEQLEDEDLMELVNKENVVLHQGCVMLAYIIIVTIACIIGFYTVMDWQQYNVNLSLRGRRCVNY